MLDRLSSEVLICNAELVCSKHGLCAVPASPIVIIINDSVNCKLRPHSHIIGFEISRDLDRHDSSQSKDRRVLVALPSRAPTWGQMESSSNSWSSCMTLAEARTWQIRLADSCPMQLFCLSSARSRGRRALQRIRPGVRVMRFVQLLQCPACRSLVQELEVGRYEGLNKIVLSYQASWFELRKIDMLQEGLGRPCPSQVSHAMHNTDDQSPRPVPRCHALYQQRVPVLAALESRMTVMLNTIVALNERR